jgi:proton glutamate symport protein
MDRREAAPPGRFAPLAALRYPFPSVLRVLRRISLTSWLLLAAAGGSAFGLLAPESATKITFLSTIFLRLIRSIIAPVLVGVLIRAVAGAGSVGNLGRLGWKSVLYFEIVGSIALLLGWFSIAATRPGDQLALPSSDGLVVEPSGFVEALENAAPVSIVDAMARGDVLQIVVFCFLFGVACLSLGDKARPVVDMADSLAEVAFRFTHYVMYLAPAAVFAAMASTVASSGAGGLGSLARFVGIAWVVQSFFLVAVIGGSLLLFGAPLRRFIHYVREPFVIAFATTSSAAALPQTLENMDLFGVPKRILGVVAPLSLSLNLNGSTIHLAMAALLVAQAAHIELSFEQQATILLTLKLTSKGVAGIPRANFVVLAALFESYGLPMEGLAMLLGVDALIDPVRTSVNVMSHCAAPVVIARWEGAPEV